MKKIRLSFFKVMAPLVLMIFLFGCSSIVSNAATTKKVRPAHDIHTDKKWLTYTSGSAGYYTELLVCNNDTLKDKVIDCISLRKLGSNEPVHFWNGGIVCNYRYIGKYTFYVIHSPVKLPDSYDTLEEFKNDDRCTFASRTYNVTKREKKPKVNSKAIKKKKKPYYRLSWKNGDYDIMVQDPEHNKWFRSGSCINSTYYDIEQLDYDQNIEIYTMTSNLAKFAASEPIYIKVPGLKNDNGGSGGSGGGSGSGGSGGSGGGSDSGGSGGSDNGGSGSSGGSDNGGSGSSGGSDNGGSGSGSDNSGTGSGASNTTPAPTVSEAKPSLPLTTTVDGITYYIDINGNASVKNISNTKKASINAVTVEGKTYPVTNISSKASKGNGNLSSLTVGSNVTNIENKAFFKCKKLKNVTITSNASLKIGKNAFGKINKKAVIKVDGVKGKSRKKLIKKIKKQTNAKVK